MNPKRAAEIVSAAMGASVEYTTPHARQFIAKGYIQPIGRRGEGFNARAVLDDVGVCRLAVLSTLTRLGAKAEEVAFAARALDRHDEPAPAETAAPVGFARVVNAIRADGHEKRRFLSLHFGLSLEPAFGSVSSQRGAIAPPLADKVVKSTFYDLTALLLPVLEILDAEEGED